jgi:hypothetical protein
LAVLGLTLLTLTPALGAPVGPHDVTFVAQRYDHPISGQSTWFYTVTSNVDLSGGLGCSNRVVKYVVIQLGGCCGVVEAGEWVDFDTFIPWTSGIVVERDWSTGIFGVKFNKPFKAGETRKYYFTVSGNYAPEEGKIKAGIRTLEVYGSANGPSGLAEVLQADPPYTYEALVEGPDLQCDHTTAIALSSFSATSPSGPAIPALLMPGVLLAALVAMSFAVVRRVRVLDVGCDQ